MYYIIGDIHGYLNELVNLFRKIVNLITHDDTLIFLGDYIDRGKQSFEVIEYVIALSKKYRVVFLKGNHEDNMLKYFEGDDEVGGFLNNGGIATIKSYEKNCGSFTLPRSHRVFFDKLEYYYEGDDFIAAHAGLNPKEEKLSRQKPYDLIWIRDEFFRAKKKWEKTVIFGHTPTVQLPGDGLIYTDEEHNIIGIDSGVIHGGPIACLRWPDKEQYFSK
ncbi:metallophosphoesterase family protein [Spirochaetota bacterium]